MRQFTLLFKNPSFLISFVVFFGLVLVGLLFPIFVHGSPVDRLGCPFEAPTAHFLLGTNEEGQDMFVRLLFGLRSSLYVGLFAGTIATVLGVVIGLIGGYKGGLLDNVLTMLTNLFIVIPSLVVLILISNSLGPKGRSLEVVSIIIGATCWAWTARAVRAQAQSLKMRDHVNLAKLNGYGTTSIILMQILPYTLSYVFMAFIIQMATGILEEAAISMMGLGPYDSVTLGFILNNAQKAEALVNGDWWSFIPAAVLVTLLQYSLFVMNTSMETIFNPRLRKEE